MSDEKLVVVDHHHDEDAEAYRLTIGYQQVVEVPVLDENGEQVFEDPSTVVDEESGLEVTIPGPPKTELRSELVPVEDFLFSAFDDRWADKSPEEIVREQKRLVRAALRKRDESEPPQNVSPMPGVGDPL